MTGFNWGDESGAQWGGEDGATWSIGNPSTPIDLRAIADGTDAIDLTWTNVGTFDRINIYRSRSESTDLEDSPQIATVDDPAESYTDTDRTDGRTPHYRVTAENSIGEPTPTNDAAATTDLNAPTLSFDTSTACEIGTTVSLNNHNDEGDVPLYRDGAEESPPFTA